MSQQQFPRFDGYECLLKQIQKKQNEGEMELTYGFSHMWYVQLRVVSRISSAFN